MIKRPAATAALKRGERLCATYRLYCTRSLTACHYCFPRLLNAQFRERAQTRGGIRTVWRPRARSVLCLHFECCVRHKPFFFLLHGCWGKRLMEFPFAAGMAEQKQGMRYTQLSRILRIFLLFRDQKNCVA